MNCSQSPPSNSFSPTSLISETNHNDGGNTNDNELALVTQMTKTARYRQFLTSAGSIHGWDVVGQIYFQKHFILSQIRVDPPIQLYHYNNQLWEFAVTKTHLTYWWHIPTMVGFCPGGNLPESHDDDDFIIGVRQARGSVDDDDGDDDFIIARWGSASMAETWSGRSLPRAVPVLLPQILHHHHHHHFHQRCRCRHRYHHYHHIMFTVIIFTTTLCSCSILKATVKLGKFGISHLWSWIQVLLWKNKYSAVLESFSECTQQGVFTNRDKGGLCSKCPNVKISKKDQNCWTVTRGRTHWNVLHGYWFTSIHCSEDDYKN